MLYINNNLQKALLILLLINILSCKKLVEVTSPVTSTNSELVYANDASATAVLTGIYSKLSQDGITSGLSSLSLFPGLSADELTLYSEVTDLTYNGYYFNSLTSTTTNGGDFWSSIYSVIYVTNAAINGITASQTLTPSVKSQLLGEAKFMRAFSYFYLVNLFGDVPLALTPDYKLNSSLSRTDDQIVYDQIVQDLNDAQSLLSENYIDAASNATEERITPNKSVVSALLARVYLYRKDYINAEIEASTLIENDRYDIVALNEIFLKNSKEAIWQLQPVDNFVTNTSDARYFILPPEGPNIFEHQVYLSENLKASFDDNDLRKDEWIDSLTAGSFVYSFPTKYKNAEFFSPVTEYTMVLRLAEQYLIRAEARARLGKISEAKSDLNIIRSRAGISNVIGDTEVELVDAILKERQRELFTEWGHRWLDLKRLDVADNILSQVKGQNWQHTDQLYPIPQSELNYNPSMRDEQNPGYN